MMKRIPPKKAAVKKKTEAEAAVKEAILKFYGCRPDIRLFNNPVGHGYSSNEVGRSGDYVMLKFASYIPFGLAPGSSDLIGWITIHGRAIFIAFEVKSAIGKASEEQLNFIETVKSMGGISGVVRSVADCEALIAQYKKDNAA